MWYFTWVLGVAFAVMFATGCGLWFEHQHDAEHANKEHH